MAKRKSCLIKIKENVGALKPGIYHYSSLGNSYVIRGMKGKMPPTGLPKDLLSKAIVEDIQWDNIPALGIINTHKTYWEKLLKIVSTLSNDVPLTSTILDLVSKIVMESLYEENKTSVERKSKSNIIPKTDLRMLYERTSDDLPKTLDTLFKNSTDSLEEYNPSPKNNKHDPVQFQGNNRCKPSLCKATQKLQNLFERPEPIEIEDKEHKSIYKYKYLGKELSPLRTPEGLYEDGKGARYSGAGGIDILCKNIKTNNPVIIEYKSEKDHSLFYALIQVLTYASELSTSNQKERLKAVYTNDLQGCWNSGKLELCIMYDKVKKMSEKKKQEFEYVRGLCKDLDQKKRKVIKEHIASISLVEVDKSNSPFRFTEQQL